MNTSLGMLYRSTTNAVRHSVCTRPVLSLRRYVNWTPDKNPGPNKKGRRGIQPGSPHPPPPQPNDPQSAAQPTKPTQQPPPPPPSGDPQSSSSSQSDSEPQLLRLKNQQKFKQWEDQWRERVWRTGQVTLVVGVFMVAYAVGAGYVQLPYGMNYRPNKLPPAGSEEEKEYLRQIEATLHSLPIVNHLSQEKDWIKTVGIFPIPAEDAPHNLTVGSLAGVGMISVPPVTFYNHTTKEFVVVMHVGQNVCGHRGLVHGGFLATILDECLGKTAITTLSKEFDAKGKKRQVWPEDRIIVTANLNVNYRAPTKVNQFLVVKSILTESTDRKANAKGRIETITEPPLLLVEGEALFVKPRKEAAKKIMGN